MLDSAQSLLDRSPTLLDRLSTKFTVGDGCWQWTGARDTAGYGQIWVSGTVVGAHRVLYELLVGPIPEGLFIDHLCHNPSCVRPAHLQPLTHAENLRRSWRSLQLTCKHGHPWNRENSYVDPQGHRNCRACRRAGLRRWYQRKRGMTDGTG